MLEAIIGAIFVDSGGSLSLCSNVVKSLILNPLLKVFSPFLTTAEFPSKVRTKDAHTVITRDSTCIDETSEKMISSSPLPSLRAVVSASSKEYEALERCVKHPVSLLQEIISQVVCKDCKVVYSYSDSNNTYSSSIHAEDDIIVSASPYSFIQGSTVIERESEDEQVMKMKGTTAICQVIIHGITVVSNEKAATNKVLYFFL